MDNKAEKEAFVTGHTGTTSLHLLIMLVQLPVVTGILKQLKILMRRFLLPKLSLLVEILVMLAFPILLVTTFVGIASIVLCILCIVLFSLWSGSWFVGTAHSTGLEKDIEEGERAEQMFVTYFRGFTTILTVISILAVGTS